MLQARPGSQRQPRRPLPILRAASVDAMNSFFPPRCLRGLIVRQSSNCSFSALTYYIVNANWSRIVDAFKLALENNSAESVLL